MKTNYNRARKPHYNLIIVKGEDAKRLTAKAEAEALAKPETIKGKADVNKAEKARLISELEYECKQLNAHRSKPYYMASVNEETAKRYESIAVKTEAVQRLDFEDIAEAETREAVTRYETCADWLAEADANKQYKPIDCLIWNFARKQRTVEAKAILTYTENGLRKNGNAYEDYRQECYLNLFEYALENPETDFAEAVFTCVKKAIGIEFRKTHKFTKDENGKTIVRTIASIDTPIEDDKASGRTLKDALPDTYAKPLDYDLVQAEACKRIYDLCKGSEAVYLNDIADGYNCKEIAYFNGKSHDAVRQTISRAKKRVGADIRKNRDIEYTANEVAHKLKSVIIRKAMTPGDPEFYHDMSHVVPFMSSEKPEYPLFNSDAFKRMIEKPIYCNRIASGNECKAIMKINTDGKLASGYHIIKTASASVKAVKIEVPKSKPKYSECDNEKLIADIRKADIKKAEIETWEAENSGYVKKLYAGIGK